MVPDQPDSRDWMPGISFARKRCRRENRSIYLASFLLPPAKRQAIHVLCALGGMIREAMDVPADGQSCSSDSADARLALLRDRLDEVYEDRLDLPAAESRDPAQHILFAAASVLRRYQVPRQHLLDLAEGFRMERTVARYATWRALEQYLDRSGGAAGRIAGCVLGVTHSDAARYASKMGGAIRFTRILRDVKIDLDAGRIYLPLEDLARFRCSQRNLAGDAVCDGFRELMQFEIERARQMFRESAEGVCWLAGDGSRLAVSGIAVMCAGVLDAIRCLDYNVLNQRDSTEFVEVSDLTIWQKLSRVGRVWRLARRRAGEPLPDVFD